MQHLKHPALLFHAPLCCHSPLLMSYQVIIINTFNSGLPLVCTVVESRNLILLIWVSAPQRATASSSATRASSCFHGEIGVLKMKSTPHPPLSCLHSAFSRAFLHLIPHSLIKKKSKLLISHWQTVLLAPFVFSARLVSEEKLAGGLLEFHQHHLSPGEALAVVLNAVAALRRRPSQQPHPG